MPLKVLANNYLAVFEKKNAANIFYSNRKYDKIWYICKIYGVILMI